MKLAASPAVDFVVRTLIVVAMVLSTTAFHFTPAVAQVNSSATLHSDRSIRVARVNQTDRSAAILTHDVASTSSDVPVLPGAPCDGHVTPPQRATVYLPIKYKQETEITSNSPQQVPHAVAASEYLPRNSVLAASSPTTTLAVQLTADIAQHSIPTSEWYKPFYSTTVTFEYHSGRVKLAARPDGGGTFIVDDQVTLKVTHPDGSNATYVHNFCAGGCAGLSLVDVTSYFAPGTNTVYVELEDVYGWEVGAHPALWLINAKPEDESWSGNECPVCGNKARYNYLGDPVNTNTGNYNYQTTDLSIPTLGSALPFERSYNAQASGLITTSAVYSRPLGYGWTHSHDIRLTFPSDPGGESGALILKAPHGSRLRFYADGQGGYFASPGVPATITQTGTTTSTTFYTVTTANQTLYRFDYLGRLITQRDPAGHVISYTYYLTGPLQTASDSTGQRYLQFAYDAQQRLVKVTDPINRNVQFGYDANSNLTVVTDTRGLPWTYIYSGTTHLLMRVVDPDGQTVVRNEYDLQGRVTRQLNGADQLIAALDYSDGAAITLTDARNQTMVNQYANGVWVGSTDAAHHVITRSYDLNFQPSQLTDANNHSTQLTWSDTGANVTRLVDASGYTTTLQYDGLNNPTLITDTRNFTTAYVYSGTLLTHQSDALGNTSVYTYGTFASLGNLLMAQQDPLGRVTTFQYDLFGQRTVMTDALTHVTRYQYDAIGRLITTTDALGRMTVNAYDNADHLIALTKNYTSTSAQQNYLAAYNLITRYGYDGFGRQIAVTDTLSHVTRSYIDGAGRLISTTQNFSPTVGQNYANTWNLITRYGYDVLGNQIAVTDTLGFVTRTDFDTLNRPVTVTQNYQDGVFDAAKPDEDLQRIAHYDPAGNVIEQIEPPNASGERRVTRTFYDSLNRVISTTANYTTQPGADPNTYNLTTWYEYDPAGHQVAITDTLQHVTRNSYDPLSRLISTTVNYRSDVGPNYLNMYNLTTRYEYDRVGNRVVVTDAQSTPTRYTFDALNRVIATTNVSGTTSTQYDALGNRVVVTDALSHMTVYTYNAVGQLMAEGNPVVGNIMRYQYDALGRTTVVTDALAHATRTFYDDAGRVVNTTNALTGTTVITYNALGRRVGIINKNGQSSYTAYDGVGRTLVVTDATGSVTRSVYDAVGNRTQIIDGLSHPLTSTYDVANRLIQTQDALGHTTRFGYDGLSNRVVMTDANNIVTRYGYDAASRLSSVTENYLPTGPSDDQTNLITRYAYDPIGNRTVMTDAVQHVTTYSYDLLSRLIAINDPLAHTTRYQYDAVGNRTQVIDANNQTTVYTYDALNRNTQIDDGTSLVSFEYDSVGNRTVMTDALGVTRYLYDELNRLKQVTDPFTGTVQYRYDPVSNCTQTIYPDGKVVTSTFDAANRLTGTLSWDGQNTTYQFDAAGRLITTTLPNGVQTATGYDNANRVVRLTHARSGAPLGDYQYVLDAVGNRTLVTETLGGLTSTVPITGFPATPVLDDFNRADGPLGSNWLGGTASYTLTNQQLHFIPDAGDSFVFWGSSLFGADQEAFVTLTTVDTSASEQDLLLKSQSSTTYAAGVIEVLYDAPNDRILVETYDEGQGWVQQGADIPVTFAAGDRFGARATADGLVSVYRNDTLLATRDVTSWPDYARAGYIGLWLLNASNAVLDNFGGGNLPAPPTPPSDFPSVGTIDDFNRSDGGLGGNWSGAPSAYAIASNRLKVLADDGDTFIFWNAAAFSATQEVAVTLVSLNPNASEIDLLLKAQSSTTYLDGVIEVLYDPGPEHVQVVTYAAGQGWVQRGADIPVTFADGDRFGARARADGMVEVYRNETLLAIRDASGWPYSSQGGYVGLWLLGASNTLLDDFAGGTSTASPPPVVATTTVITHTYDPLYRLTGANSSGAYTTTFGYTYDAVGNRTVQTRTIASTQVITYQYDNANRLTNTSGVAYTWDNNGNLISDGSATYLYDRANRLISTTLGGTTSLFNYNGDGARLTQIVAGVITTYTQDLAAPLPVVLQAQTGSATTQYLYALGTRPLGQNGGAWEYLLPDALGSVRQIVDANGNVTLAKSYEPYGSVLNSSGSATSVYGFTGEQTDSQTGLLFLRARYLQPTLGIFLARDPWSGDQLRPGSMNGWNYGLGNPVNLVDPSGLNPNCKPRIASAAGMIGVSYFECASERFVEITTKDPATAGKNALTLVALFEDAELTNLWGDIAGRSSETRLQWLLGMTRGAMGGGLPDFLIRLCGIIPNQFGNSEIWGTDDSYFKQGLRDNQFYQNPDKWKQPNSSIASSQVGHFLTAVAMTRQGWRHAIIAHEKLADNTYDNGIRTNHIREQFFLPLSETDYQSWEGAIAADEAGRTIERDRKLWTILDFDPTRVSFEDVDPRREGNSLQDLRLSVKGVRFAQWVETHKDTFPIEAAHWLRRNILQGITK